MTDRAQVRADFDRIAVLARDRPERLACEGARLLRWIPSGAHVVEVGCGAGDLTRRVAARAARVTAIDLSPEMIALAHARGAPANVAFLVADVLAWAPSSPVDVVISIAALHHLPFESTLRRLRAFLRPGGRLVVEDLFRSRGPIDRTIDVVATLASLPARWRAAFDPAWRAAWAAHGAHDELLPLAEIRRAARAVFPEARVERRLRWRYTLIAQL